MAKGIAFLLILLYLSAPESSSLAGSPDISFEELVHDFGEIQAGEVVTHTYRFRNIGDEDLSVSKVSACCGVKASRPTPDIIPAGGGGEIEVTFSSRGKEGQQRKKIRVSSNDPDEPIVELEITGVVRPAPGIIPRELRFGKVPRGGKNRKELTVFQVGEAELEWVRVESSVRHLSAEVSEITDEGGEGFRVLVTLSPDAPLGELAEKLEIHTNLGGDGAIEVPVSAEVIPDPDIHFEETAYDFGEIEEGEDVVHIYKFRNLGRGELNVSRVRSCCGVRASLTSSGAISPGGEGGIEVTFCSTGREGGLRKKIRVNSNDPDEPIIQLEITGVVKPLVAVVPRKVVFGQAPRGEKRTEEFKVLQVGGKELKSVRVESSTPHVATEVSQITDEGQRGFRVLVTLSPDAPSGELAEKLEIYTNLGGARRTEVPVHAKISGDISVVPDRFYFRGVGEGDSISRKILVTSRGESGFEILRVRSDLEFVSTDVSVVKEGRRYEVAVSLKIDDLKAVKDGVIEILTSHPTERVIRVPVYFYRVKGE